MSTEYLDAITVEFELPNTARVTEAIDLFKQSDDFSVRRNNGQNDTGTTYTVSWGGDDSYGTLKDKTLSYRFDDTAVTDDGVESIRDTIGGIEDINVKKSYVYSRMLSVGEARAEEFVNKLLRKLEQMGYSASSERGYGGWLEIENDSVADSYKEYKWWIYAEKEDGTLSEHNVDLYFTEDGIYIGGHVVEGAQNEKGFREILTDFSISSNSA